MNMNTIAVVSLLTGISFGAIILATVVFFYLKWRKVSTISILSGVILVALPIVTSLKLGLLELQTLNNKIFEILTQVVVVNAKITNLSTTYNKPIVLVFYMDDAATRAEKIVNLLKIKNSNLSKISTDFQEIGEKRFRYTKENVYIYIKYTPSFENYANSLKDLISNIEGITKIGIIQIERAIAFAYNHNNLASL